MGLVLSLMVSIRWLQAGCSERLGGWTQGTGLGECVLLPAQPWGKGRAPPGMSPQC